MSITLRYPVGQYREGTYTVDITDPEVVRTMDLTPVFVAMAREQRFANLLPRGIVYSVLHHSTLVSALVRKMGGDLVTVFWALHHDAHEGAGFRDLPSPVKQALRDAGCTVYDDLTAAFDRALMARFGIELTEDQLALIKKADGLALRIEQNAFQDAKHSTEEPFFLDGAKLLYGLGALMPADQHPEVYGMDAALSSEHMLEDLKAGKTIDQVGKEYTDKAKELYAAKLAASSVARKNNPTAGSLN